MLHTALRSLRRSPLFATIAIVSIALALSVNATLFAVVDATIHPRLPYADPASLSIITFRADRRGPQPRAPDLEHLRTVPGATLWPVTRSYMPAQTGTHTEDLWVAGVVPSFFGDLGVEVASGRALRPSDASVDATPGAVVSYRFWRSALSGAPLSDSTTITVGIRTYRVVGVAPRMMHAPFLTQVWVPFQVLTADQPGTWPWLLGRRQAGVTRDMLTASLQPLLRDLEDAHDAPRGSLGAYVASLSDFASEGYVNPLFALMLAAAWIVLLIACANLSTLLLARTAARKREIAVRMALGARGASIARMVLAECGIITFAGAAGGVVLTLWSLQWLVVRGVRSFPELGDIAPVPRWSVFGLLLLVCAATVAIAGTLPAMRAARTDPATPLKSGGMVSTERTHGWHRLLVGAQIALCMALLMTAGLLAYQVRALSVSPRWESLRNNVQAIVRLGLRAFPDDDSVRTAWRTIAHRAAAVPGVTAVATEVARAPDGAVITGESGALGARWVNAYSYSAVSPGYLDVFGYRLLGGRDFTDGDAAERGAAIVDDRFAKRLWPDGVDPIGRLIKLGGDRSKAPWIPVVGIARLSPPTLDDETPSLPVIVVEAHAATRMQNVVIRADRDPMHVAVLVRHELAALMPDNRIVSVSSYLDQWRATLAVRGFMARMFTAFAAFAILLAGMGLYGLMAYDVTRRQREYAVRQAIGASAVQIARQVVRDAVILTLGGIAVGAFFAETFSFAVAQRMSAGSFTFVASLVVTELVVVAVAVAASASPVRRAVRADLSEILRPT